VFKWLAAGATVVVAVPLALLFPVTATAAPSTAGTGLAGGPSALALSDIPPAYLVLYLRVILYAAAQLGKPYLWGATGPDAFDCSGPDDDGLPGGGRLHPADVTAAVAGRPAGCAGGRGAP
jgi:hypothetical protein